MLRPSFLTLLVAFCDLHLTLAKPAPGYTTDLKIASNLITNYDEGTCVAYTSVLEYSVDTSTFTDGQIAGLAQQAWEEMKQAHEAWIDECEPGEEAWIESKRPNMMSAIAAGPRIFFATSMKGNVPNILLTHENGLLTRALAQCRLNFFGNVGSVDADNMHSHSGNCGEIMAAALHLQLYRNFPWDPSYNYPNIRVVAFGLGEEGSIQNPCGTGDPNNLQIGCKQFVRWTAMTPISQTVTPVRVLLPPARAIEVNLNDVWKITETTE